MGIFQFQKKKNGLQLFYFRSLYSKRKDLCSYFKLIFKFKKRSHQDLLVPKIPSIYVGCVFELIFKVHSLQHKKINHLQ